MADIDSLIFAHPAAIQKRAADDSLLAAAKDRHAVDPSVFADHPPYFFGAEVSSNRLDSYYTRMAPSSLRNYAADLAAGVSFQNSHRHDELGLGRSLTGTYEESGTDLARVTGDFYTIPGLNLNGVRTDDFILGVRSGIVKDVSIGFVLGAEGRYRCSICGQDMMRWRDCFHVPGMEYEVRDDRGDVTGSQMAIAWVEDARLCEVSSVYDGATPGAAITKARQESDAGRLRPDVARMIESRYRIQLPGSRSVTPGVTFEESRPMPDAPKTEERSTPATSSTPAELEQVRSALTEAGQPGEIAVADGIRALATGLRDARAEAERLKPFEAEAARLKPLAEDGTRYRADLLREALEEGVRAHGAEFSADTYRPVLESASLDTIRRFRADWKAQADKLFAGGRKTTEGTVETPAAPPARQATPDAAFAA